MMNYDWDYQKHHRRYSGRDLVYPIIYRVLYIPGGKMTQLLPGSLVAYPTMDLTSCKLMKMCPPENGGG